LSDSTRRSERDPGRIVYVRHTLRMQAPARLFLASEPIDDLEAATAAYVDAAVAGQVIQSVEVTPAGDLVITLGDASIINAGAVVGPAGPAGATGPAGAAGPAGPAAVVGTAKGTWNASTNTPTLSSGSGVQGDAYVVSAAGSTALDGISTWAVGDIALRGATAWGRVPVVATSAFDEITVGGVVLGSNAAVQPGIDLADPYGEVWLRGRGNTVSMNGITFGTSGPVMTAATIGTATVTTLSAETAVLGGDSITDNNATRLDFSDPYGEVLFRITAELMAAQGVAWRAATDQPGLWFTDPYGEKAGGFSQTGDFKAAGVTFNPTGSTLQITDKYGELLARFSSTGELLANIPGVGAGAAATVHSDTEIAARNGENLGAAAGMAIALDAYVARPIWQYNAAVVYGQSLGAGSEGTPTLSRTAKWGNLMVGTKTTSVNNSMPAANNATPPTWQVTGGAAFNPLVATDGISAETVLHGALNTYRRMTLTHRGQTADATRLWVGAGAAVGGQDIAALQQGAAIDLFNRIPSLLTQMQSIATGLGGSFGAGALLFLQGESDQTRDSAYYLPKLRDVLGDWQTYAISITGQADPPAAFIYQTTAANVNFDNANLGVPQAQLTAALNDNGVFMIGPTYPVPDSDNLHLPANGYRWLGSQFGKVMHRVLTLGHRWKPLHIRRATLRGLEVLVDFHVPYPPLVFDDPWLQAGWTTPSGLLGQTNTKLAQADRGFSVLATTGGVRAIAAVQLVSETQVLITLASVPPAGSYVLRIADGVHFGHASVRDSDPALADDEWLDGLGGQTAADTNAALSGARYPLWNWAVAQQVAIEVGT
jgi:hypothetical protein